MTVNNIQIIKGDIADAETDAIVNAANCLMLGGSGVDGAIHQSAGPELLKHCREIEEVNGVRCPVGGARITLAGNLRSKYVIHGVGPQYGKHENPDALLRLVYKNSLNLAKEYQCVSIAFPAISCGAYG